MKYIVAALMCGLLSLTLTGCQQSGTADVSISPAASSVQPVSSAPTASSTEPVNSAPDSIRIQLTRVEEPSSLTPTVRCWWSTPMTGPP